MTPIGKVYVTLRPYLDWSRQLNVPFKVSLTVKSTTRTFHLLGLSLLLLVRLLFESIKRLECSSLFFWPDRQTALLLLDIQNLSRDWIPLWYLCRFESRLWAAWLATFNLAPQLDKPLFWTSKATRFQLVWWSRSWVIWGLLEKCSSWRPVAGVTFHVLEWRGWKQNIAKNRGWTRRWNNLEASFRLSAGLRTFVNSETFDNKLIGVLHLDSRFFQFLFWLGCLNLLL